MPRTTYLDAAQKVADERGITRKELLRSFKRAEVNDMIRSSGFDLKLTAKFVIDPAILEAGDKVAANLGIPRKEVFRTYRTARVLEMAAELP